MKTKPIVTAKLGADGEIKRIGPLGKSGRVLRGRINAALLDSPAAFAPDADTPILTRRELRDLTDCSNKGAANSGEGEK